MAFGERNEGPEQRGLAVEGPHVEVEGEIVRLALSRERFSCHVAPGLLVMKLGMKAWISVFRRSDGQPICRHSMPHMAWHPPCDSSLAPRPVKSATCP